MLYLTKNSQVLLATSAVDFRKQIDGLIAVCEQHLQESPQTGAFFVFINRSRSMVRVLHYESNGYWLATKRLSKGKYKQWPNNSNPPCKMQSYELTSLLKNALAYK